MKIEIFHTIDSNLLNQDLIVSALFGDSEIFIARAVAIKCHTSNKVLGYKFYNNFFHTIEFVEEFAQQVIWEHIKDSLNAST